MLSPVHDVKVIKHCKSFHSVALPLDILMLTKTSRLPGSLASRHPGIPVPPEFYTTLNKKPHKPFGNLLPIPLLCIIMNTTIVIGNQNTCKKLAVLCFARQLV
jgi:hypothetical protein